MAEDVNTEQGTATVTLSPQMALMQDDLIKATKARQERVGPLPLDNPDQPIDSMDLARPGEEPPPEPEPEPEPEQAKEPEAEPEKETVAFTPTDRQRNIAANQKIDDATLAAMPQEAVEAMERMQLSYSQKLAELGRKTQEAQSKAVEPPAENGGEAPSAETNGKLPDSFTNEMWGSEDGNQVINDMLKVVRQAESRMAALEANFENQQTESITREVSQFYDGLDDSMKDMVGRGKEIMPEQQEARDKLEAKAAQIMAGAHELGDVVPSTVGAMQEALAIIGLETMRAAAKAEVRSSISKRSASQIPRATRRATTGAGGDERSRMAARIDSERARRGI